MPASSLACVHAYNQWCFATKMGEEKHSNQTEVTK